MNTKLSILSLSSALALAGCGGTELQDTPIQQPFTAQLLSDTASGSTDIVINSVVAGPVTADNHTTYAIQATDIGAGPVDTDNLSFALEYSKTEDFNSVYRIALFDLQTTRSDGNSVDITARAKPVELPSGTYNARLTVNPNWQTYIENNLQPADLSQPLRYIAESNHDNNSSDIFTAFIETDIQCAEDNLEGNNTFLSATQLSSLASVSASLCEDNADYFALPMLANQTSVLSFIYDGAYNSTPTQYALISDDFHRQSTGVLEGPQSRIQLTAAVSGTYYLAIFGARANYTIDRDHQAALKPDWFFSTDTVEGPISPVLGAITLNKLNFNVDDLLNKTVRCAKQIIDPLYPDTYTTPLHFPDAHEFRLLEDNKYLLDGTNRFQWGVSNGDISNDDWYENPYHGGWAENLYDGRWRYWEFDAESYVQCEIN